MVIIADIGDLFTDYEKIFGSPETRYLARSRDEYFECTNELSQKLGRKTYLLHRYIGTLLKPLRYQAPQIAVDAGLRASTKFREVVSAALQEEPMEHYLYERTRSFIHDHPLEYQNPYVRACVYSFAHLRMFMDEMAEDYWFETSEFRQELDIDTLRRTHGRICKALKNSDDMDRLNDLFKERFLIVPAINCFIQSQIRARRETDPETRISCFELID